jgi:hypothetical protein
MNKERLNAVIQASKDSSDELYHAAKRSSTLFEELYKICDEAILAVDGKDYPEACSILLDRVSLIKNKAVIAPHTLKSNGDFELGKCMAYSDVLQSLQEDYFAGDQPTKKT